MNSPILLRRDTQHYVTPIPQLPAREAREEWFHNAKDKTGESDVIFLNPDTGIDWQERAQPTHVDPREINRLLEMRKIVIIYQHQRHETHWIENTARNLRKHTLEHTLEHTLAVQHLWVCRWGRVSVRTYFIAARTSEQRAKIEERIAVLRRSPWVEMGHITLPEI